MGRRKPKRLKTGDKPNEEVVKVKVRVKVKSDNGKEEDESSDDDDEEEEEQVAQPLARVKQPAYVEPRPDYILMDYDKSVGDVVIKHPHRLDESQRFRLLFDSGCSATRRNKKFVKHWKKQPVKTIK
jgi:hypothetical protein